MAASALFSPAVSCVVTTPPANNATHASTIIQTIAFVCVVSTSTRPLTDQPAAAASTPKRKCSAKATATPAKIADQLIRDPTDTRSSVCGTFEVAIGKVSL